MFANTNDLFNRNAQVFYFFYLIIVWSSDVRISNIKARSSKFPPTSTFLVFFKPTHDYIRTVICLRDFNWKAFTEDPNILFKI